MKKGKKKKRAKEKKNVELLNCSQNKLSPKRTNRLHSPDFCCISAAKMANNSSETSSKSSDTPRHKFGQICTFGFGQEGRLGHGDARDQSKPTLIVFDTKIKFTQVAGGAFHSLALTKEGKIWSWGRGLFGQLGTGDTETRYRPILVDTVPPDIIFAKIAAGSDHSLAITTTGRLYTWGRATKGTLGHGDSNNQLKPKLVEFFKETTKVTSADGGSCFSVVTTGIRYKLP